MKCAIGHCGHCQLGPTFVCRTARSFRYDARRAAAARCGSCERAAPSRSSRSGSSPPATAASSALLDCEDELLALAGEVEIAYFLEATRATVEGPYDLSLVEGSITTAARRRADPARSARASRTLVTIGACATAGGIQALRNFADVDEFLSVVYATPGLHLDARDLDADRRPRAGRLRAARLPDRQAPAARGDQRLPQRARGRAIAAHSVCIECKRRGNVCVMVAHGTPCLGPVTHAGCGALCPTYDRGCYGCFGPMETPEHRRRSARWLARRSAPASATSCASTAPSTPTRRAVPRGERARMSATEAHASTVRRASPASRARARCTSASATATVEDVRAAHLRAAALLRGVPARPRASPRRPTSPRASAASARSPTR